ncbi:MAG: hypothetical protein ACXVB5_23910 [Isosphaeraceae bacterium]
MAAAGNGVYAARTVNYTVGAGPHFGVALDHNFAQPGLSFLTKIDFADTFSRVRQRFSVATTSLTPAGQPSRGELLDHFWSEIPILNFQVGLGYQPPRSSQRPSLRGLRVRVLVASGDEQYSRRFTPK